MADSTEPLCCRAAVLLLWLQTMASMKHYRSKLCLKYDIETKQFVKDGGMDAVGVRSETGRCA